jgi:hypothetical protein
MGVLHPLRKNVAALPPSQTGALGVRLGELSQSEVSASAFYKLNPPNLPLCCKSVTTFLDRQQKCALTQIGCLIIIRSCLLLKPSAKIAGIIGRHTKG